MRLARSGGVNGLSNIKSCFLKPAALHVSLIKTRKLFYVKDSADWVAGWLIGGWWHPSDETVVTAQINEAKVMKKLLRYSNDVREMIFLSLVSRML